MADYKDIKYNVDYSDTSGAGGLVKITSIHQAQNDNDAGSDTFDFTTGIDDTYDVYVFELSGMIPHGTVQLSFQVDTGTNTNYNITNTSMVLSWYHGHDGAAGAGGHGGPTDNDTGFIKFTPPQKGSGDPGDFQTRGAQGGYLYLFNPSSTTFVKHFILTASGTNDSDKANNLFVAGYGNTTSAVDAIDFKFSSGNIDSGVIKMYGLSKS